MKPYPLEAPSCAPCTGVHWRVKDMVGERFGRLLVTAHAGKQGVSRNHRWACICDCGVTVTVSGNCLRSGVTKSCGCIQREKARAAGDRTRTHGMTRTTTHNVWSGMHQRCNSPTAKDYPRYGGRGIKVCERWSKFENFLVDMGERPAGLSLDRINNDGNYEPGNCRWATAKEQANNKRNTRRPAAVTHHGVSA